MAEKINEVGRLGIRIQPNTDRFDDDLRTALKKAQKTVEATIKVAFDVSEKALRDVEKRLESITASVGVDVSAKSMKQVERKLNNLQGQAAVHANVEGAATSSGRLAYLTRPRIAPIIPKVDTAAFAAATVALNSLAALSGARVLDDVAGSLTNALTSLDRTAYTLMKTGPLVTSALTGALSTVSSLTSATVGLGNALVGLAPAALVLPGVFAGAAASITAVVSGVQKAKAELVDYYAAFNDVFDVAGDNAWARSGENITRALDRVIPVLYRSMAKVGDGVGRIFAAIADAIGSNRGLRDMRATFDDIARSLAPLSRAVYHFTQAMMSITRVGASFLPRMAESFARMADSMSKWADAAARSGRMHKWIEGAVQNARELWRVIANLGGVLSGLFTAINAGSPATTVSDIADSFERLNKTINSADVQQPLQALFRTAQQATRSLAGPMANMTKALGNFTPVLNAIMKMSAGAIGAVISALAQVINTQAFRDGAADLFAGLAHGLKNMSLAIKDLGPVIGPVLSLVGALAVSIGRVLSTAIRQFAPLIGQVATSLAPIVLNLGQFLANGIETFGNKLKSEIIPRIRKIIETDFLPVFDTIRNTAPRLFEKFQAILPQVVGIVGEFFERIKQFSDETLPKIQPLVSDMVEKFKELVGAVADFAKENPQIVAALAAGVAFLPQIASAVGTLFTVISALMKADIGGMVARFTPLGRTIAIIGAVIAALWPYLKNAVEIVLPYIQDALDQLSPKVDLLREKLEPLVGVFEWLRHVAGTAIEMLAPAIGEAVGLVIDTIGHFFDILGGLSDTIIGLFTGDWERFGEGLKSIFQGVFDFVKNLFGRLFNIIRDLNNVLTGGRLGNLLTGKGWTKNNDSIAEVAHKSRTALKDEDLTNGQSVSEVLDKLHADVLAETKNNARVQPVQNINIYNPTNEPASETLRRNAAQLAL